MDRLHILGKNVAQNTRKLNPHIYIEEEEEKGYGFRGPYKNLMEIIYTNLIENGMIQHQKKQELRKTNGRNGMEQSFAMKWNEMKFLDYS